MFDARRLSLSLSISALCRPRSLPSLPSSLPLLLTYATTVTLRDLFGLSLTACSRTYATFAYTFGPYGISVPTFARTHRSPMSSVLCFLCSSCCRCFDIVTHPPGLFFSKLRFPKSIVIPFGLCGPPVSHKWRISKRVDRIEEVRSRFEEWSALSTYAGFRSISRLFHSTFTPNHPC